MAESALLNNRYQLLEPLGTGGMAQVYRARDLMLERFVAIKMLRSDYSADPNYRCASGKRPRLRPIFRIQHCHRA